MTDNYNEAPHRLGLLREAVEGLVRQRRFYDAQALMEVEIEQQYSHQDGEVIWRDMMDRVIPTLMKAKA